jgi:hypothetical protein
LDLALREAAAEHPRARQRMLVLDRDTKEQVNAKIVTIETVSDWLLAEHDAWSLE